MKVGGTGWKLKEGRFQFNCLNSNKSYSDLTMKQVMSLNTLFS